MAHLRHYQPRRPHDDSSITKGWCVFGLVVSWIVGFVTLVAGSFTLYQELRDGETTQLVMATTWKELLPLLLNMVVTLLNDCMGYIHTCSLRWALHREAKLEFNSNLRLLTAAKKSPPNGFIANALYLIGIIFSYGATSLIFISLNPELARVLGKAYDKADTNGVHINAIALLALGVGFFLQAVITTWALVSTNIQTWSSNPLIVARTCLDENDGHRLVPEDDRCMMSVHDYEIKPGQAQQPRRRQRSMFSAHFRVRRIVILLGILPILGGAAGGAAYGYLLNGSRTGVYGRSWSLLPVFTGKTDTNCETRQCTDGTSVLNMGWSAKGPWGTLGGVLLVLFIQSIVTLSLHCAELIVNLSRDEKVWRELIGDRGTDPRYSSLLAALTSWQTIFLFILKSGVHWMFGLAVNMQYQLGVNLHPPQIFYFSGFSLITAIFGTLLSLWRPKGYLPASYGHLQTIVDIIDEWSDSGCLFWGEKVKPAPGQPGFTGTHPNKLPQPDESQCYGGRRGTGFIPRDAGGGYEMGGGLAQDPPYSPTDRLSPSPPPGHYSGGFGGYNSPPPPQHTSQYGLTYYPSHNSMNSRFSDHPSHSSMNSRFSGASHWSNSSTQPFLHQQPRW